jgi:hypothetical protein
MLSILLGVDEGDATASLGAEDARRRDFVPVILDSHVACEAGDCAKSVMALAWRGCLPRPLDDGGRPYMLFPTIASKAGKVAEKALWNFQLKSSGSSSPKV